MKSIKHILFELAHSEELAKEERQMRDKLRELIIEMQKSGILLIEAEREFKTRFLLCVLNANRGNQCSAARETGMHRNTMSRAIRELKLARLPNGIWVADHELPARKQAQPVAMAAAAGARQA